jgi:acyl-CoA reductase-like NAD-dependent aldehyde dehydrogenase
LITLGQQWQQGDAAQRNAVLSALWERIEVRNRKIVKLTARADRREKAHQLIATALEYVRNGEFHDWNDDGTELVPVRDGGPGASRNTSKSGKGGIRTLEGALHPLPA